MMSGAFSGVTVFRSAWMLLNEWTTTVTGALPQVAALFSMDACGGVSTQTTRLDAVALRWAAPTGETMRSATTATASSREPARAMHRPRKGGENPC
jgi:hypothetical protein